MKTKLTIIITISAILIALTVGGCLLLEFKEKNTIITKRELAETTNDDVRSELEEKIDMELQEQDSEFKNKIDEYIDKIYRGVYTYMPEFKDINLADEKWIWECVYSNMLISNEELMKNKDIISREVIDYSIKQLWGNDFKKEFPKEGISFYLEEVPEENGYFFAAFGYGSLDFYNDFEVISYEKNDNTITVNIVEFKYNEWSLGEPTELNLYKINSDEVIKSFPLSFDGEGNYEKFLDAKEFVKNNPTVFTNATVTLEYDEELDLFYIKSFER